MRLMDRRNGDRRREPRPYDPKRKLKQFYILMACGVPTGAFLNWYLWGWKGVLWMAVAMVLGGVVWLAFD